ncbi:flagellar brake protein [Noviherbaspirillum sp. ST9]|uniref:flagellar brake protein n=1 Tax=Noviherbaspirillum sp. ST9 TaxID=3401606 RepID=UPI003B588748
MSLISIESDKLAVGTRLPWTVYDQERNVLMERGQVIETEEQLQLLVAANPLRELSLQPPSDKSAGLQGELDKALSINPESRFTFQDMRLRVGDRIQLQPPASMGTERHFVRLLGYLENASLMVSTPMTNGMRVPLREHDKIVARVFSSQKAFAFDCAVVRVCKIPYDYLHLSFPDVVQGAVIRKSPRIKTKIIASIATPGDGNEKQPGVIVNLSADGALVKARQQLAGRGGEIVLAFRVNLHNMEAYLTVKAIVRNVFADEEKEGGDALRVQHGIQFLDLQPNDSVILQSLIYQQIIEQPHTLA